MPDRIVFVRLQAGKSIFIMGIVRITEILEGLLTDHMLHPTGVLLGGLGIHASVSEHLRKETVFLIGLLRHLSAYIGQVEEIVTVHRQEAPVPQGPYSTAHAWL